MRTEIWIFVGKLQIVFILRFFSLEKSAHAFSIIFFLYNDLVHHLHSNLTFAISTCHCYRPQTQARTEAEDALQKRQWTKNFSYHLMETSLAGKLSFFFSIKNSIIMFLKELSKLLVDSGYEFAIM